MVEYAPKGLVQNVLTQTANWPGYLGRTSRRKLRRRYGKRAVLDFDRVVQRLGPNDIALDFGANYGDYTDKLARTGATVHAYEPDPDTFQALQKRFAATENVVLHECAVSAKSGTLTLRRVKDYELNPREKSVGSSIVYNDKRMSDQNSLQVPVVSFWDVIAGFSKSVSLIKMDIEGAEWDVLAEIFEKPEPLGFEHLFVETHEFLDWSKQPIVEKYRSKSAALKQSTINLYWP